MHLVVIWCGTSAAMCTQQWRCPLLPAACLHVRKGQACWVVVIIGSVESVWVYLCVCVGGGARSLRLTSWLPHILSVSIPYVVHVGLCVAHCSSSCALHLA